MVDELFSKCTDNVLGIEFEIPITAGAINTRLIDHNVDEAEAIEYAGHQYSYNFENYPPSLGSFENLAAVGWGNDFSMSRGSGIIHTKFVGCSGATICEEISPNVLLTLHFPNPAQCNPEEDGMTYIAYGAVVIYRLENPEINLFYFTGPTIIKNLNDELISSVVNLNSHELNCNEDPVQQFNSKLDEILMDIEQGTLDETSTQNIELLYHIAESIEFIEQP